ncbi:uncharacterized protein AB9X84_006631 isoform 3-T4 [Acanthopagrus schlegelii]
MMEHGYSLPRPSADAVPQKRKCTGEANDPRRLWDKKRGKTRVNIGVAFPKWRELRDKLGLQKDADLACLLLDSYEMKSSILLTSTGTCMHEPPARSSPEHVSASARGKQDDVDHQSDTTLEASEVNYPQDSSDEMEVAIDEDSMKNRLSDLDSDVEKVAETSELSGLGADDSCDEEVYVPTIPQRHLSTKSELLLECEEEELEPWQKQTSHARLKEGDDSGELSKDQADCSPEPSLLQRNTSFIGTSPRQQLTSNAELIGSLGIKCRAGNSFTVLPASKKRRFRNVATTTVKQEACDEIIDNQESLSGVRSPAVCGATSYNQLLPDQMNSQTSPVNLSLPCFAEHEHKLTAASSKR